MYVLLPLSSVVGAQQHLHSRGTSVFSLEMCLKAVLL